MSGAPITKPSGTDPIFDLLNRFRYTQILTFAHEIKLFPLVRAQRQMTIPQLASALQMQERAVQALLSVLLDMELLDHSQGQYTLTQISLDFLLPDSPYSWVPMLELALAEPAIMSYDALKKSFLSNRAQIAGGDDFFEENDMSEEASRFFTMAMHAKSLAASAYWPEKAKLGKHRHFLDIAGGSGVHSIAAVKAFPSLNATVLERPFVCKVAEECIRAAGLEARVKTHGANMWADPYPQADVHFYCDVLHDWPREKCMALLKKSFDALPAGGQVLLHEMLFAADKSGPSKTALYNLTMLFWTEGQQFSRHELTSMLEEAGFGEINTTPTGYGDWHLVSAVK